MQASDKSNIEGRIALAIQAYNLGLFKSLCAAARSYNILHTTLTNRYQGILSRHDTQLVTRKLTSTKEEVLIQRILSLDAQGFPPRISVVQDIANIILASREITPPPTVGKNWPTNFIKRSPQLYTIYNRKYDYQRSQYEDLVVI